MKVALTISHLSSWLEAIASSLPVAVLSLKLVSLLVSCASKAAPHSFALSFGLFTTSVLVTSSKALVASSLFLTTSKALVTTSKAPVPSSFFPGMR